MAAVKTEKITIRISDQEKEKLQKISTEKDIPMSQIIREAIKKYIQEQDS